MGDGRQGQWRLDRTNDVSQNGKVTLIGKGRSSTKYEDYLDKHLEPLTSGSAENYSFRSLSSLSTYPYSDFFVSPELTIAGFVSFSQPCSDRNSKSGPSAQLRLPTS